MWVEQSQLKATSPTDAVPQRFFSMICGFGADTAAYAPGAYVSAGRVERVSSGIQYASLGADVDGPGNQDVRV